LLPLQLLQPLQGRLEAEQVLYLQLQRLFKQPNKTIIVQRNGAVIVAKKKCGDQFVTE
jgi:hypothetical protein